MSLANVCNVSIFLMFYLLAFTSASDGLSCWLLEKIAELVLVFCVWGVPAFCRLEIQGYWSEVYGDIQCHVPEAVPIQHYLSISRIRFKEKTASLRRRKSTEAAPSVSNLAWSFSNLLILVFSYTSFLHNSFDHSLY